MTFVCLGLMTSYTSVAQEISDSKIKQNVTPIANAVNQLKQLEPVSFTFNNTQGVLSLPKGLQYGFMSDDAKSAIPEIVKYEGKFTPSGKNAFKTTTMPVVDMVSLIPFLVSSIKEQQEQIDNLKAELRNLKSTVSTGK